MSSLLPAFTELRFCFYIIFLEKCSPRFILIFRRSNMKKVRITVLKTTLDAELAKEYGVEGL